MVAVDGAQARGAGVTMSEHELADEVRTLIANHITSVEQLEILLLLRSRPDADFGVDEVADEMRTSGQSARGRLEDLRARGLVSSRADGASTVYRYQPATDSLRRAVERLADAYAERRYTVIELIFAKPIEKLRLYADAFRFRKDDPDG
jgi:hypothetical protein